MTYRSIAVILLILVGVWTGGCRSVQTSPSPPQAVTPSPAARSSSPEVALRERVKVFWEARLKDDAAQQYDFLEPEAKERVPMTPYVRGHGTFEFQSYEIRSVRIVGEQAWVKVQYTFKMRVPQLANFGPWTQETFEIWILQDGEWYRPYKQEGAQTPPAETGRLDGSDFS